MSRSPSFPQSQTSDSSKPVRWKAAIAFGLLLLLFWASMFSFPVPASSADLNLDKSWELALSYLFRHHAQAGRDYLFTYGPLGAFYGRSYDPGTYWWKYAWEILLKLSLAVLVLLAVRRMPGKGWKVVYCLLFLGFLGENRGDTLFPHLMLAGALLLCAPLRFSPGLVPFLFLLVILSLVKFSIFVLSALYVLVFVAYFVTSRQRGIALLTLAVPGMSLLGVWVVLGQSPGNLVAYLRGSLQLTEGYTAGMAMEGNPTELYLALATGSVALLVIACFDVRQTPSRAVVVILFVLVGLFQQWKSAFVRHDQHSYSFFVYAMLVPFLLPLAFPGAESAPRWRAGITAVCVVQGMAGYQLSTQIPVVDAPFLLGPAKRLMTNLGVVLQPVRWKNTLDASRANYPKELFLPRIQKQVGSASIDLFTENQSILLINNLNYRPRPVLQSSSAYTRYLLELNATFLRSADAPEYLLLAWISIHSRLPTLEDNQALTVIFQRYEPLFVEGEFLLLRRRARHSEQRPSAGDLALERDLPFGTPLQLSPSASPWQTLAVRIRYSWWGRFRAFFYKPPPVFITVRAANGRTDTFRLIPAMSEDGFLLNPLVRNREDMLKLFSGAELDRVESFVITRAESGPRSYESDFQVTLRARPDLAPPTLRGGSASGPSQ
jgi:hypothetical protein